MIKKFSRLLSAFLSAVIVLSAASVSVFAESKNDRLYDLVSPKIHSGFSGAVKDIYDGMARMADEIDVGKYNLTSKDCSDYFEQIMLDSPELFYVGVTFSYVTENGKITSVRPQYEYNDIDEIILQVEYYNKELDKIVALAENDWSDFEKALFAHDYIVNNFEYDDSYTYRDVYNFFKKGTGVCESYTKLFTGIMKELGVYSTSLVAPQSDKMREPHTWNIVRIDGEFYHLDTTWDDAMPNGEVISHSNFLLSDKGIEKTEHYGYTLNNGDVSPKCNSTKYESSFVNAVTSTFEYANGKWYFVGENSKDNKYYLSSVNASGNCFDDTSVENKACIDEVWRIIGDDTKHWVGNFTTLALCGDSLYFNKPNEVYKFNYKTEELIKIYENGFSNIEIYGLYYDRNSGVLNAVVNVAPDGDMYDFIDLLIEKVSIDKFSVTVKNAVYSGGKLKPQVTVMYNGTVLENGVDYTVKYTNNINAGNGTVTVTAIGKYIGEKQYGFIIEPKDISETNITVKDIVFNGQGSSSYPVTVKDGNTLLKEGRDYVIANTEKTVSFGKNTIEINGINNYCGSVLKTFNFVPSAIKNFKISSQNSNSIKLSWSRNKNCSGYEIFRATSKNGSYKKIAQLSNTTTSFTNKKLKSGTVYYYRIRAVLIGGNNHTAYSSVSFVYGATAPSTPKITVKALKGKKAKISYKKVSGATKYMIYYSTKKSSGYKRLTTTNKLSYTKSKLKKGKKYYFKVRAYKELNKKKIYGSFSSVKYIKAK